MSDTIIVHPLIEVAERRLISAVRAHSNGNGFTRELGDGDTFSDLFPGSGGISRAWSIYASQRDPVAIAGERDASRVAIA